MKKYLSFSGRTITQLQIFAILSSLIGAFFVSWTFTNVLILILFYYLYNVIGMSMMLHRYFSHRMFEFKNRFVRWIFLAISVISARGSPLAWVHIHRTHHAHSDTDKDPHRPGKFSIFSFRSTNIEEIKPFLIRDMLNREQKIIHEYYLGFILLWIVILLIISPSVLYFAWILPLCANQVTQDLWNYYSHTGSGYRNFETKDNSRNVVWLWPFIFGEAWHNNHHNTPGATTKFKSTELDPVMGIINIVKR